MGRFGSFQDLDVVTLGHSTVEALGDQVGAVLGESSDFLLDLVGKLSHIAQDEHRVGLGIIKFKLLQDRNYEYCRLAHSRDSLAKDISAHDGLGNALLLNFGGVLETTLHDCSV